jgi:hypothetical protein
LPGLIGVVIGIDSKTPPLATLIVLPLKNLFASGIHILIGQESSVRLDKRFSVTVSNTDSIAITPLKNVIRISELSAMLI